MDSVFFFDDDTRKVPDHIARELPLLNEGHFVVVVMDNGVRWDGVVTKSNDGLFWLVGGHKLIQVHYSPFKVWVIPWNVVAIVNFDDYQHNQP
jgi:hypothetical protein